MSKPLVICFGIFLFVLLLEAFDSPRKKDAFAARFESPPVRARIYGKVSEMSMEKGNPVYSYIVIAGKQKKDKRFGRGEEFEVNRIDYAQMQENTDVDLFFDGDGKYAAFRLAKSNIPVKK
ncbi:MAG: hypothetical protein AAGN15_17665 [Cyanobacteria bacterium J06581_3]